MRKLIYLVPLKSVLGRSILHYSGNALYPLKTPRNLSFLCAFRRYKMGTLTRNGLTKSKCCPASEFLHTFGTIGLCISPGHSLL